MFWDIWETSLQMSFVNYLSTVITQWDTGLWFKGTFGGYLIVGLFSQPALCCSFFFSFFSIFLVFISSIVHLTYSSNEHTCIVNLLLNKCPLTMYLKNVPQRLHSFVRKLNQKKNLWKNTAKILARLIVCACKLRFSLVHWSIGYISNVILVSAFQTKCWKMSFYVTAVLFKSQMACWGWFIAGNFERKDFSLPNAVSRQADIKFDAKVSLRSAPSLQTNV